MTPLTIHLVSTRLKQRLQLINDAIPGIILLFTGMQSLLEFGLTHRVMPYFSVVIGFAVVRFAIGEWRHGEEDSRVKWFDIASGAMILLEAASRYSPLKNFQPAHLLALAGIITILRGIFPEKRPRLRKVVLNDEKVYARTSLFHFFTLRWNDIVRIERSASALVFVLANGTKKLHLRRASNRVEVMDQILAAARDRGPHIALPD